jgi:hypothetical protein
LAHSFFRGREADLEEESSQEISDEASAMRAVEAPLCESS